MRSAHTVRVALGILALMLMSGTLVAFAWAQPPTRMAAIETVAPLQDRSEQSIKTALKEAVTIAVRGAVAMGLPWIRIHQALVLGDVVTVRILATDVEAEGDEPVECGEDCCPACAFPHPSAL